MHLYSKIQKEVDLVISSFRNKNFFLKKAGPQRPLTKEIFSPRIIGVILKLQSFQKNVAAGASLGLWWKRVFMRYAS